MEPDTDGAALRYRIQQMMRLLASTAPHSAMQQLFHQWTIIVNNQGKNP
jgi:hypothetical protein